MRIRQRAVGDLHRHVVDVVSTRVGWCFEVRRCNETQRAGAGVDCELRRIGTTADRVSQRLCWQVGIGGCDGGHRSAVLGHIDGSRRAAAIAGDDGGVVVDRSDCDGNGLRVNERAVGDLHRHVVDVVGTGVGRRLKVRRRNEAQRAGVGVDRKLR